MISLQAIIDTHVHLRDWEQKAKGTIFEGLEVAYLANICAVFEMPNTDEPIISRDTIEARLKDADKAIAKLKKKHSGFKMFHGLYAGVTADKAQLTEVVDSYNEHRNTDRRIVGLKMFAGQSTGEMGLVDDAERTGESKQRFIYKTLGELGFDGVLAVHCEKEEYIIKDKKTGKQFFEPKDPYSHTYARPGKAELESVKDQIKFAKEEKYGGILHICHVSTIEALEYIESVRDEIDFEITTEVTPHHIFLSDDMMNRKEGVLYKMNPPLRDEKNVRKIRKAVLEGRFTCYGSDHAPHTRKDKLEGFASGVPTLHVAPYVVDFLQSNGMHKDKILDFMYNNAVKLFGLEGLIPEARGKAEYNLGSLQHFDVFKNLIGK